MKIFQLIDLIIRIFRLNKRAKAIALFLIPFAGSCQGGGFYFAGEPYLLDAYPGASAAYSVRKLRRDYTGNAMQIRRASDSATANIGFIDDNLDTPAISSHCTGTDCFVVTWYDQSGNGNHATQSTAANQPKIWDSATGLVLENGKPAIQFDGTNDYLQSTDTSFASGSTPETIFFVSKFEDITTHLGSIIDRGNNNAGERVTSYKLNNVVHLAYSFGFNNFTLSDTNTVLINYFANSPISNSILYLNGNLTSWDVSGGGTDPAKNTVNNGTAYIGTNNIISTFHKGTFQALFYYPTDQTANRVGIETSINNYFSIY